MYVGSNEALHNISDTSMTKSNALDNMTRLQCQHALSVD
jgi:hypothetical protein